MPLPVRDSSTDELEALLAKEALAEAVPLACGLKVMVKSELWPAARLNGNEIPLRVNSEVLGVAEATVTLEPVALSVALKLLVWPTMTLPKSKVPGLTLNWPAAMTLPASEMVRVELEALETTEMLPLVLPAETGARTMPKVKLCPAIKVSGRFNPVMLNAEPVRWA